MWDLLVDFHPMMSKKMIRRSGVWLLVFLMACTLDAQAQEGKPSRAAAKAYAKALEAYRFLSFNLAVQHLDKAIDKSPEFAEAWFLKAQIQRDVESPNFESTLAHALSLEPSLFPHGWVQLAEAQWNSGKYAEGMETLQRSESFLFAGQSQQMDGQRSWVEAGLRFGLEAMSSVKEGPEARIVPGGLNSDAHEYYGAFDLTGEWMVFTRSSSKGNGQHSGQGGEDFYSSLWSQGEGWSTPVPLRGVNTAQNEGAPTLSGDGRTMVFTACATPREGYGPRRGKGSCDLFESTWDETAQKWTLGKNLGAPNSAGWESQPTLSADGNTLIFAKAMKGHDAPSDLAVSHRLDHGGWSAPKSLPGLINTARTEESPFLHPDGKTLYFSSNGHPGMGGLDVFVSRREKDGTWGAPKNLGPGVNSYGKDNSLMVTPMGDHALFASTRGSDNLNFWEIPLEKEDRAIEVATLTGVVVNAATGESLRADVILNDLETGQRVASIVSQAEEGFLMPLPALGSYSFEASAEGFVFGIKLYDQSGEAMMERNPFVKIELEPIEAGQSFTLDAIQFESGLAQLSQEFQAGCERLTLWMEENPEVRIQIEGHTDNVGSLASNMALSHDRALAVSSFLTDRGIDEGRLEILGLGPNQPIADNTTENGRFMNRRVQVMVLK
jgi:outer membrane protein OmpA-like peptidoglycan-associated protein